MGLAQITSTLISLLCGSEAWAGALGLWGVETWGGYCSFKPLEAGGGGGMVAEHRHSLGVPASGGRGG